MKKQIGLQPLKMKRKRKRKVKTIELFAFIDPICNEYWRLEPIIKKLTLQYGQYFTLRYILVNQYRLQKEQQSNTISFMHEYAKKHPSTKEKHFPYYTLFTAIKAAELQGRTLGNSFFRKVQECIFLQYENVTNIDTIDKIAQVTGLDLVEFKKDMESPRLIEMIHRDGMLKKEMKVDTLPALVFFHSDHIPCGVTVTGEQSYDIYVHLLQGFLETKLEKQPLPSLSNLIQHYHFVSTTEIMYIYHISKKDAERQLKQLMLQGEITMIQQEEETYWKNIK
ncbi:MAG: DsbA family protein [Bacillaceae bacterium]